MTATAIRFVITLICGVLVSQAAEQRWAPIASSASSADTGTPASSAFDGNLSTRWSANGIGQWLQADLGQMRTVTAVQIAFFKGNERQARFNIAVSGNGSTWTNIWGTNRESSGTTVARQRFAFPSAVQARYVRFIGAGNTSSNTYARSWNSIFELDVMGTATTTGNRAPVVAASIPNRTATVNTAFSYTIPAGTFSDPDANPLTWSVSNLPVGLSFNASTRVISGTPTATGAKTVIVTAKDPGNLSASTTFTITVQAAGVTLTRLAPTAITASSAQSGNPATNAFDGNMSTRWAAEGIGQWLRADLGQAKAIAEVRIAFFSGNLRKSRFNIQTSNDGNAWTNVWSSNRESSGTTTARQTFAFPAAITARYVRYLGAGNTVNTWSSLFELDIMGTSSGATPPPTSVAWTPTGVSTGILNDWSTPNAAVVKVGNRYVFITGDANWKVLSSTDPNGIHSGTFGTVFKENLWPKLPVELDSRPPVRVTVRGTDGVPVAGATVTINGQAKQTNGNGDVLLPVTAGQGATATVKLPAGMTFADGKNSTSVPASSNMSARVAVKQVVVQPGLAITEQPAGTGGSSSPAPLAAPVSINNPWWQVIYGSVRRDYYTHFHSYTAGEYVAAVAIRSGSELGTLADVVIDHNRIQIRPRKFYQYLPSYEPMQLSSWSGSIRLAFQASVFKYNPNGEGTYEDWISRFNDNPTTSTGSVFSVPSFQDIMAVGWVKEKLAQGYALSGVRVFMQPTGDDLPRTTVIKFTMTDEGRNQTAPPATRDPNPLVPPTGTRLNITDRTRFGGRNSLGGLGDGFVEILQGTKARISVLNPPTLQGIGSLDRPALDDLALAWTGASATSAVDHVVSGGDRLRDDGPSSIISLLPHAVTSSLSASDIASQVTYEYYHGTKVGSWTGTWDALMAESSKSPGERAVATLNTDTWGPGYYYVDVVTTLQLKTGIKLAEPPPGWVYSGNNLVSTKRTAIECRVVSGSRTFRVTWSGYPGLKWGVDMMNTLLSKIGVTCEVKDKGYVDVYRKWEVSKDTCEAPVEIGINGTMSVEAKANVWVPNCYIPLAGDPGNGIGLLLTGKLEPALTVETVKIKFPLQFSNISLAGRMYGRLNSSLEFCFGLIMKNKNAVSLEVKGGAAVTGTMAVGLDSTQAGVLAGGGIYTFNFGAVTAIGEGKVKFAKGPGAGQEFTFWKQTWKLFDGWSIPSNGSTGTWDALGSSRHMISTRDNNSAPKSAGANVAPLPHAGMP